MHSVFVISELAVYCTILGFMTTGFYICFLPGSYICKYSWCFNKGWLFGTYGYKYSCVWLKVYAAAIGGLLFILPRFGSSSVLCCMVVSANGLTNSVSIPGIPKKLAPTIGIVVDHRHRNRSLEGPVLSILREKPATKLVKVTEEMKSFNAFAKIRLERTNKHHQAEDQSSGSEKAITVAEVEPLGKDFASRWKAAIELITRRKKYVDEIDWNLLAVPPSGSVEEELQRKAGKKFVAFKK
ncbi:60S ribosomal protein L13-1-like protein [Tanacetum coccineum]